MVYLKSQMIGVILACLVFFNHSAQAITLIYSNDVLGEIEPCGCRTNPLGGIVRKANLLKTLPDANHVSVDAGDLLFGTDSIPPSLASQSELQARYLLKTLDRLNHDVIVPGEKDFALGTSIFLKLTKETKIKFLAANLNRKKGGTLLSATHIIKKLDSKGKPIKIGVIGLVGTDLKWPTDLKATPAIPAAKKAFQSLKSKVDLVIAVTHQGLDEDKKLAQAIPGLTAIIGAHSQSFLQSPLVVEKVTLLQSSFRNQYVGILALDKKIDLTTHRLAPLDASLDDKESPSEVGKIVAEFKQKLSELNLKEDQSKTESAKTNSGEKYHTFPKCSECHFKQFDFWRKTPHALAYEHLIEKNQAQNKECITCHSVGFDDPNGFSHVGQLSSERKSIEDETESEVPLNPTELNFFLKQMIRAKNLDTKIKIRSEGSEAPLRNIISQLGKTWTPVQCENCHSPGKDHPFSKNYTKTVAQDTCLKCHTVDRAPTWYENGKIKADLLEKNRAKMTCPAGEEDSEQ